MIDIKLGESDLNRRTRLFYTYGKESTINYNINAIKVSPIIEVGYRTCADIKTEIYMSNVFKMMNDA